MADASGPKDFRPAKEATGNTRPALVTRPTGGLGPYAVVAACLAGAVAMVGLGGSQTLSPEGRAVLLGLLSVGTAALVYGILGSVGSDQFNMGPIRVGGSAAVLFASVFLFNWVIQEGMPAAAGFDPDEHVQPDDKPWYAIERGTRRTLAVKLLDPSSEDGVLKAFEPPAAEELQSVRLEIHKEEIQRNDAKRTLLRVVPENTPEDEAPSHTLGQLDPEEVRDLFPADSSSLANSPIWGPQTLCQEKVWCLTNLPVDPLGRGVDASACRPECLDRRQPFRLAIPRAGIPVQGTVLYELHGCDQELGADPKHTGQLNNKRLEQVELLVDGTERSFVVGVIEADFTRDPSDRWARFVVFELEATR